MIFYNIAYNTTVSEAENISDLTLTKAVFKTNGHPWQPKNGLDQLNLTLGK